MAYSQSFADARAFTNELHTFIGSRKFGYCGGLLKIALMLHNSVYRFGEGCLLFQRERRSAVPETNYNDVIFYEQWLEPATEAENWLGPFLTGQKRIGNHPVTNHFARTESRHQKSIDFSLTGWQEWIFQTRVDYLDRGENIYLPQEPLIRNGLPPYLSAGHAIADRLYGNKNWNGNGSPYMGHFLTILPDTRARLFAGEWGPGNLSLQIESHIPIDELEIQILMEFPIGREGIIVPLKNTRNTHKIPYEVRGLDVFLVHKSGECLSQAHLPSVYYAFGPGKSDQQSYQRAVAEISSGESQEVEYKSFIKPGDEKESDIVEAVIAFANTSGGRIYLGVRNDGSLQGIDILCSIHHAKPSESSKALIAHIQTLIVENIKPVPRFEIEAIRIRRQPVFVISVAQGRERPYSNHQNKTWIRKGATNRIPDLRTELPSDAGATFPFSDFE